MSRFVEQCIARAGLLPVLTARRAGDVEAVRATKASWQASDLIALGAVADLVRSEEVGDDVRIHEPVASGRAPVAEPDITWVTASGSELDVLRAVAVARLTGEVAAHVGLDWSECGLELAQVALGFGVTELRGPITRKSGLPILDDEAKKVKGQGMVELRTLQKQEIAQLVTYAGRRPVFIGDTLRPEATRRGSSEAAGA